MSTSIGGVSVEVDGVITDERYHEVMGLISDAKKMIDELTAENAALRSELDKWEGLAANIELPEYPVTQFQPRAVDMVNEPPHYTQGSIEVIDVIEDSLTADMMEGYCIGNVMKYVMRYRHKNGVEDLMKARWYLDRAIGTINDAQTGADE